MAPIKVTTSSVTLHPGTIPMVDVGNVGTAVVKVTAGGVATPVRPGQTVTFRTGGSSVTAATTSGESTVVVSTSGAPNRTAKPAKTLIPRTQPRATPDTPTATIVLNSSTTISGYPWTPTAADTGPFNILGGPLDRWTRDGANAPARYNFRAVGARYAFSPTMYGLEFEFYGTAFDAALYEGQATACYALWVDDVEVIAPTALTGWTTNARTSILRFAFASAKKRKITLWVFKSSLVNITTDTPIVSRPAAAGASLLIMGDSYSEGSAQNTGSGLGTWPIQLARYYNVTKLWHMAMGSTGYIATNGSTGNTYATRFTTDILPLLAGGARIETGIMLGYYNDRAQTAAAMLQPMQDAVAGLKAAVVNPLVVGTPDPLGTFLSPYVEFGTQLQTVCAQMGVPYLSPKTGVLYGASGEVLLTAGAWIVEGSVSTLVGSDSVHGTDAWHGLVFSRVRDALDTLGY